MKNKNICVQSNNMCKANSSITTVELKKMQWASALNGLMIYAGKTRTEMAEISGISKGRITRILSGDSNLTLETICKFANALGYDVDIAFYDSSATKPYQPWNNGQVEFATFKKLKKILSEERTLTTVSHDVLTINNVVGVAIGSPPANTAYWVDTFNGGERPIKEFVF